MNVRQAIVTASLAAMLTACGPNAQPPADTRDPARRATMPRIAPAIIPPEEFAGPAEPPSYEVAIATAAAARHKALGMCESLPAAMRTQCERQANAAFEQSRTRLQALRGNAE